MKKILLINLLIFLFLFSSAQKGTNKFIIEYEDTLQSMAELIMKGETEEERISANNNFIQNLKKVLQYEKSFKYDFDSLLTIAKLRSPDNTFRIFNWLLRKDNGSYDYYAIVHYHNKNRKKYEIIDLIDNSSNIRNPEQEDLDATNWYGGLYYQIAYIKKSGRKFYTLLAWDGNNGYSTKKIIDVMYFSGKNKIKFGLPIFKDNKNKSQKRVILEYDSKTSVSVRYYEKEQKIIFNHLIPSRKDLTGLEEYYIPDGSFNAYKYEKGKWWLEKDVDARNKIKEKKRKKTRRGLIPK